MHWLPPPPPAYVLSVQAPGFMLVPGREAPVQTAPDVSPEAGLPEYGAEAGTGEAGTYHGQPWLVPPDQQGASTAPVPYVAPVMHKPGWILVLPVEQVDGKAVWGRDSAWSRQWIAPVRRDGMRLVTNMGDADDRMKLSASMLAQPDDPATASAALALGRKYGAPAVALARLEAGTASVYLWRAGADPQESDTEASPDGAKSAVLDLLVSLADPGHTATATADATPSPAPASPSGKDTQAGTRPSDAASQPDAGAVDLETHPEWAQDGQFGFAVVLASTDTLRSALLKHQVAGLRGVHVLQADTDQDGAVITGSYEGDREGLVAALSAAGVKVSADD